MFCIFGHYYGRWKTCLQCRHCRLCHTKHDEFNEPCAVKPMDELTKLAILQAQMNKNVVPDDYDPSGAVKVLGEDYFA